MHVGASSHARETAPPISAAAGQSTGPTTAQIPRILIVDDDQLIVWDLSARVEDLGYQVCGTAPSADRAVRLAAETEPDAILMDVRLRGKVDGITAAERILARHPVPVIFITAFSDPATTARIKALNAAAHLTKPVQTEQLRRALDAAL